VLLATERWIYAMCIDYRALNKIQFSLPRIDTLQDDLAPFKVFSSLDLQAGYNKIRRVDTDVEKRLSFPVLGA
jgi:hypothetical protein